MIPALSTVLDPLRAAVRDAEVRLDRANRNDRSPLECLPAAGAVIREQGRLIRRMLDLLDVIGEPITDDITLEIQGRILELERRRNTQ